MIDYQGPCFFHPFREPPFSQLAKIFFLLILDPSLSGGQAAELDLLHSQIPSSFFKFADEPPF